MLYVVNIKFFCLEAKFSLVELRRSGQYPGKDLNLYVRRFNGKALYYCDPVDEETLVNVFLHSMVDEYNVFIESLVHYLLLQC